MICICLRGTDTGILFVFCAVLCDFFCIQAEARLAARRQARAEAREIRMRELERQQKEIEENADSVYDMYRGDGSS
jgi:hypothetical protein